VVNGGTDHAERQGEPIPAAMVLKIRAIQSVFIIMMHRIMIIVVIYYDRRLLLICCARFIIYWS
jgi:hypothetical protein